MFKRRYWSEPKRHRKRHGKRHRKRHRAVSSQRAAAASELVPILAPRRASKDGCRFRCVLCAVGRVKADRRGPKGHPGLASWGLGGTFGLHSFLLKHMGLCDRDTASLACMWGSALEVVNLAASVWGARLSHKLHAEVCSQSKSWLYLHQNEHRADPPEHCM